LDLGIDTDVASIDRHRPLMALSAPTEHREEALSALAGLVLTPKRPGLSVMRAQDSECGIPPQGRILVFLNQTLVRCETVDGLPSDTRRALPEGAEMHAFCIPNTWNTPGCAILSHFGNGAPPLKASGVVGTLGRRPAATGGPAGARGG